MNKTENDEEEAQASEMRMEWLKLGKNDGQQSTKLRWAQRVQLDLEPLSLVLAGACWITFGVGKPSRKIKIQMDLNITEKIVLY